MHSLFFFILSSTCFGCYLHPSSGAQIQRTAIGVCMVLVCTYTHLWLYAAFVLLRMTAKAPETCKAKNKEE
jgi:hypothetical protein